MKSPIFTINPNFRLQTPHLELTWHIVPVEVLQSEAVMLGPVARIYSVKSGVEIIVMLEMKYLTSFTMLILTSQLPKYRNGCANR